VFGDADKNIPVEGLRFMAQRAGARAVTEVPGASHSVMVSEPEQVVAAITQAIDHLAG
jgi:pimeloyl-ACP methyl ester carboxylesterase